MFLLRKVSSISLLFIFSLWPLTADESIHTSSDNAPVPNVPEFSVIYEGDTLVCSPTELIKTKTHKDLVKYQCQKDQFDQVIEKDQDDQRGRAETMRLESDVKNKITKGVVYTVEIPLDDAQSPTMAKMIAGLQLKKKPHGKYLRMLLPAKIYISFRPQLTNSNEDGTFDYANGGSRGGFYYYYQFNENLELTFQYEAGVDWNSKTPFINVSDTSDSNRRLSYIALQYFNESMIVGKYWSAYYDIAGFTDRFMAYGAKASGAFNSEPSGTGRAEKMVQIRSENEIYNVTLQAQVRHDASNGWNTDYDYTVGGSLLYKGLEEFELGAALNYGKFSDITAQMQNDGIQGNDFASIIGLAYKKNNFAANGVFSYTRNHMSDDQGVYFNGVGAELYMQYDIGDDIRIAGGGNWLLPKDSDYNGEYSINNLILTFEYTFGKKTFDDVVYLELFLPNGKYADGESQDASITIGLRYLIDY